jgi:citrate lyase subunit beta/citryl-CoA lyase
MSRFRMPRSLLFVPGDSERKQTKALESEADALILDLEDSVDAIRLPAARRQVAELLMRPRQRAAQQRWVRVNALSSGLLLEDLVAVLDAGAVPDGILLPKVRAPQEVVEVDHYLSALEMNHGHAAGSTRLIVLATETPQGLLSLPQYPAALAACGRLAGLTWGMEDLGAALGAREKLDASGELTFPFQLARAACLLTAASLNVAPIDGVHARFRDLEGLGRALTEARRDGFVAKLAIHPDQISPINAAFTPTAADIERARKVIAAFAAAPGAGVVSLEGQMLDRPHLIEAQRVLAATDS